MHNTQAWDFLDSGFAGMKLEISKKVRPDESWEQEIVARDAVPAFGPIWPVRAGHLASSGQSQGKHNLKPSSTWSSKRIFIARHTPSD